MLFPADAETIAIVRKLTADECAPRSSNTDR